MVRHTRFRWPVGPGWLDVPTIQVHDAAYFWGVWFDGPEDCPACKGSMCIWQGWNEDIHECIRCGTTVAGRDFYGDSTP